ncbi:MAG: hypothetical protein KDK39_08890 [Leptospiraceae bacterium]|nr:hypothetical protein [Leptospiraceae bacterium]
MLLHSDCKDFIEVLHKNRVRYVIIGAYALAMHGQPHSTGDIDIWLYPDLENAGSVLFALTAFGFASMEISAADLLSGNIIQLGYPPVRIDLLTQIDGVSAAEIWQDRVSGQIDGLEVYFMGKETLRKNKQSVGRHKDLADLELLDGK